MDDWVPSVGGEIVGGTTVRVWLIGGTGEAVALATALATEGIPCLVTVTTAAARRGYPEVPGLVVRSGALDPSQLQEFIATHHIGAVLDASHPFAVEISQGAIAAARALGLPYWRYERPMVEDAAIAAADSPVHLVGHLDEVLTADCLAGRRVLLTLGYRWLHHFAPWQPQAILFARILPSPVALAAALAAGFTGDRLIALRPPIGADLEAALWRQWRIERVITKASGAPGGEAVKRAIARQLGISLYVIQRPCLDYPRLYSCQESALAACRLWAEGEWAEGK